MAPMGEFQGKSHCWQENPHRDSSHIQSKIYLDYPQDFWANILWTDKTKVELFGRCVSCYIWRKTNTAFNKNNIIPAVKHRGGSVMVWSCFAASGPEWPAIIDGAMNSLSENPEGECRQFVTSSSSALGLYSRTMIQNTPTSPPLNGSRKPKVRFWSGQVKVRLKSDWNAVAWP